MKYFWPYRYDDAARELWNRGHRVPLSPKAAELLSHLLADAGQPVHVDRLLAAVWRGVHVQPANVKAVVHELRTALGDTAVNPRFIRSEHGRGYTFVAGVTAAPAPFCAPAESGLAEACLLPGRENALNAVHASLVAAREGATRVVLVEGERGFGKTTLCHRAAAEARRLFPVRVTHGQAVAGSMAAESYGVLADALALCLRQYPQLAAPLREHAPTWWSRIGHAATVCSVNSDRWLRELTAGLAELSRGSVLLMVLEDLDWGDAASVSALRHLARAAAPTGTCIVATYRRSAGPQSAEVDSLRDEIAYEPSTSVCPLGVLSSGDVAVHLKQRFGAAVSREAAGPLFESTGGHPHLLLFAIDSLIALRFLQPAGRRWKLVERDHLAAVTAATVADLWRLYLRRLNPLDRRLLDAAATIGLVFRADDLAVLTGYHPDLVAERMGQEAARRVLVDRAATTELGSGPAFRFRSPVVADQLIATAAIGEAALAMPGAPATSRIA